MSLKRIRRIGAFVGESPRVKIGGLETNVWKTEVTQIVECYKG